MKHHFRFPTLSMFVKNTQKYFKVHRGTASKDVTPAVITYQSLSRGALLYKCGYIFLRRRRKVACDSFPVAMPPLSLLMRLIDVYEMANVFDVLASIFYRITCILFFVSLSYTQNSIGKSDLCVIYFVLKINCFLR